MNFYDCYVMSIYEMFVRLESVLSLFSGIASSYTTGKRGVFAELIDHIANVWCDVITSVVNPSVLIGRCLFKVLFGAHS